MTDHAANNSKHREKERVSSSETSCTSLRDQLHALDGTSSSTEYCGDEVLKPAAGSSEEDKMTCNSSYVSDDGDETILSQEPQLIQPLHIAADNDDISLSGRKLVERKLRRQQNVNSRRNLMRNVAAADTAAAIDENPSEHEHEHEERDSDGENSLSDIAPMLQQDRPTSRMNSTTRHDGLNNINQRLNQSLPALSVSDGIHHETKRNEDVGNDDDDDSHDGKKSLVSLSGKKLAERKARRSGMMRKRHSHRDLLRQHLEETAVNFDLPRDTPPVRPPSPHQSVITSSDEAPERNATAFISNEGLYREPDNNYADTEQDESLQPPTRVLSIQRRPSLSDPSEHSKAATIISAITLDSELVSTDILTPLREENAENLKNNAKMPTRVQSPSQHSKSAISSVTLDEALVKGKGKGPILPFGGETAVTDGKPNSQDDNMSISAKHLVQKQQQQLQRRQSPRLLMQKAKSVSHLEEQLKSLAQVDDEDFEDEDDGWDHVKMETSENPFKNTKKNINPIQQRKTNEGLENSAKPTPRRGRLDKPGPDRDTRGMTRSLSPGRSRWCSTGLSPKNSSSSSRDNNNAWQIISGDIHNAKTLVFTRSEEASDSLIESTAAQLEQGLGPAPRFHRKSLMSKSRSTPNLLADTLKEESNGAKANPSVVLEKQAHEPAKRREKNEFLKTFLTAETIQCRKASEGLNSTTEEDEIATRVDEDMPSLISADRTVSTMASSLAAMDLAVIEEDKVSTADQNSQPVVPQTAFQIDGQNAQIDIWNKPTISPLKNEKESSSRGFMNKFKKQMKTVGHAGSKYLGLSKNKDSFSRQSQSFSSFDFKYKIPLAKLDEVDELLSEEEEIPKDQKSSKVPNRTTGPSQFSKSFSSFDIKQKPASSDKLDELLSGDEKEQQRLPTTKRHGTGEHRKRSSRQRESGAKVSSRSSRLSQSFSSLDYRHKKRLSPKLDHHDYLKTDRDNQSGDTVIKKSSDSETSANSKEEENERGGSRRQVLAGSRAASVPNLFSSSHHEVSSSKPVPKRGDKSPKTPRSMKSRRTIRTPSSHKPKPLPPGDGHESSDHQRRSRRRSRSRDRQKASRKFDGHSPYRTEEKRRQSKSASDAKRKPDGHRSVRKSTSTSTAEKLGSSSRRGASERSASPRGEEKRDRLTKKSSTSSRGDSRKTKRPSVSSDEGSSVQWSRSSQHDGHPENRNTNRDSVTTAKRRSERSRVDRRLGSSVSTLQSHRSEKEAGTSARPSLSTQGRTSSRRGLYAKKSSQNASSPSATAEGKQLSLRNLYNDAVELGPPTVTEKEEPPPPKPSRRSVSATMSARVTSSSGRDNNGNSNKNNNNDSVSGRSRRFQRSQSLRDLIDPDE